MSVIYIRVKFPNENYQSMWTSNDVLRKWAIFWLKSEMNFSLSVTYNGVALRPDSLFSAIAHGDV